MEKKKFIMICYSEHIIRLLVTGVFKIRVHQSDLFSSETELKLISLFRCSWCCPKNWCFSQQIKHQRKLRRIFWMFVSVQNKTKKKSLQNKMNKMCGNLIFSSSNQSMFVKIPVFQNTKNENKTKKTRRKVLKVAISWAKDE